MQKTATFKYFILFSLFYLTLILIGLDNWSWYLKPFLMPFLLIPVFNGQAFPTKKILLAALAFSGLGDVSLMFVANSELFFILGLVAFLTAHIIYILLFTKQPKLNALSKNASQLLGLVAIVFYLGLMLSFLLPHLGGLKIPVTVYAFVISTMLFFAFKGNLFWQKPAGNYVLLGALFFVISDSILAFNKFYSTIPMSNFLIMGTYCAAQYFIVIGIVNLNTERLA